MSKQSFFGGLAIFAMFFGSGNLIFPLLIGKEAHEYWLISVLGLGITGVLLPVLGLLAMLLLRDNMEAFFHGLFNKFGSYIAAILILLLCGPLGVIPRCVTVAEGAWKTFSPNHGSVIFVAVCCGLIWCSVYFKSNLLDLIGKYFTPFKLLGLLSVIFGCMYVALKSPHNFLFDAPEAKVSTSFLSGLINGYGTMDLFSALFFGPTIVAYFIKPNLSPKETNKECIIAMIFGFLIILFLYACLIYLGATYAPILKNVPPTEMLPTIVEFTLGRYWYYMVSLTLIIATFVTAVALTSVTVDYVTSAVKSLSNSKGLVLNGCVLITFIFAVMGFGSIMAFLMPILQVLYPVTIFILIINMFNFAKKKKCESISPS